VSNSAKLEKANSSVVGESSSVRGVVGPQNCCQAVSNAADDGARFDAAFFGEGFRFSQGLVVSSSGYPHRVGHFVGVVVTA